MQIGTTVTVLTGAMAGQQGVIVNTAGAGWSYADGAYILYSVRIGVGRYARVYSFRASQLAAV